MQKTLYIRDIASVADRIDRALIEYIKEGQIETFEGFRHFDILAFDWYDIYDVEAEPEKILIYLDADDVFFLCENELSYRKAVSVFHTADTNERAMYDFLQGLIRGDTKHLEQLEDTIVGLEDAVITREEECVHETVNLRRELLRLKKQLARQHNYYEQILDITDAVMENENSIFDAGSLMCISNITRKVERLREDADSLRAMVEHLQDAYSSHLEMKMNSTMKIFTVLTSIFFPLTIIVGWYGMNFRYMPELQWRYGYLYVIVLSVVTVVILSCIGKKKRWF